MKKGDIISLRIESLQFPDKAKGKVQIGDEYKTVKVKHAIPGQLCEVMITKKRGGKFEGRVLQVLEPAPNEVDPCCSCFGHCGGCSFLNLPYEEELKIKETYVRKLMTEAGVTEGEWEPIVPSPTVFGYRNKMEYSFGDDIPGGPLHLGLHERGSFYNILSTPECKIADEDFITIQGAVQKYFQNQNETYFHKRSHEGFLRHLVIRKGKATGEILINLVTTSQHPLNVDPFVQMLRDLELEGTIVGILHTINEGVADVVQGNTELIDGRPFLRDSILGLNFEITAFSFFQTNTLGAEKLYNKVRDFVLSAVDSTSKPVIYDLYCGTGTIAQVMAPIADHVVGIEIVAEAVEAAKRNAKANGLNNCSFIAGDVLKEVEQLTERPQIIILDPPREGIHPKAIFKIIDFNPDVFVYVACKPESLARDLPFFTQAGYQVKKLCCVDLFPHTGNVETVCLLSKQQQL